MVIEQFLTNLTNLRALLHKIGKSKSCKVHFLKLWRHQYLMTSETQPQLNLNKNRVRNNIVILYCTIFTLDAFLGVGVNLPPLVKYVDHFTPSKIGLSLFSIMTDILSILFIFRQIFCNAQASSFLSLLMLVQRYSRYHIFFHFFY